MSAGGTSAVGCTPPMAVELLHAAVRGRVRLRSEQLHGDRVVTAEVESRLRERAFVRMAEANP